MGRSRLGLLWSLYAILAADAAIGQAPNADLESFDIVWTTIRDTHWQKQPGGLDWEAMRAEYRPRVEQAADREQARGAMSEMLRRLKQTHFGIVPGSIYAAIETDELAGGAHGPATAGIELRVLDGEAVVTRIDPGSPAERAGIHAGWIVKNAGGRELRPVIEQAARNPEIHELQLTRALEARLSGNEGETVNVTFVDGTDKEVAVRLGLATPRGNFTVFGNLPPQQVWFEDRRITPNGSAEIGYFRFNAFLDIPRLMPAFEKAVTACSQCRGFIIDLRGNPGGIGGMAMGMAGFLVDKAGQKLGTMITRDTELNFVVNPRANVFKGPVAVLIDGNSASTAEIFAGGLQDMERARIFGTRSAGAALPSVFTRLPNGDGFQHAIANYVSANGKALEGDGVRPNEEIRLTRQSLLAGRDAVIDRAVEWIGQQ